MLLSYVFWLSEGFPVIFLRFEDVDERNCDNKEEISPEVLLWQ